MEEQIFDVSILTKSCSFKKEKIQKYKLFAALIGTHGKTDWKEINANLQGKNIYLNKEVKHNTARFFRDRKANRFI